MKGPASTRPSTPKGFIERLQQADGINHFQVNHKIGLSFAKIMRSMLRQDPDVILVGEIYQPSDNLLREYFNDQVLPDITFNRGKGCSLCKGTGYQGRVGVFEMIEITEAIRSLIAGGAPYIEILRAASAAGFRGMRYDALQKVLLGLTSLEEVERGTMPEFELN